MDIPTIILDWDFDNFSVMDEYGYHLMIYDAPDSDFVFVEGWLWPGNGLDRTLYKRIKNNEYMFVKYNSTDILL